jgi:colanic acid biosynthesis glycosyl transferase WcaI
MLLHVGQIEEGRGLDTLIRAFARTVGQRGDWTLVLAGDGPAGRSLRVLADRLGVGASLRWLTRPRDEELPGLLGSATLFAAPTLAEADGTLKIRRALACGLPVLASDLARTRELVEPDGCGLLVEPGDVEAWTQAIRQAASSPERRKRWSARARQLASERMSWPVIAERYEAVLLKAVEEERVVPAPSPEGATR